MPALALALASILALAAPRAIAAADPLGAPEQAEANFVFAHRLGSGIYELSGRTLQIYRLPLQWRLREPTPARPGLTLTLPVTAGFFDFRVQDVIGSGLPTRLSTVSFVPGLRWDRPLGPRWRLEPFVEAGIARDNGSNLEATVATVGTEGLWRGETRWGMARYVAAASYAWAMRAADHFALLSSSVQLERPGSRPLFRERRLLTLPYAEPALVRRSARHPFDGELLVNAVAAPRDCRRTRRHLRHGRAATIGRVKLPAIGIGYRFGENLWCSASSSASRSEPAVPGQPAAGAPRPEPRARRAAGCRSRAACPQCPDDFRRAH